MRRAVFAMERSEAVQFLSAAPTVQIAGFGRIPILRTVHPVVVARRLFFHGSSRGEKQELADRNVIVAAEEVIAEIPSHFLDPERACPATTFYRSVQAHGVLTLVEDANERAVALQAIMEKYQPEGGYAHIRADDPRYEKSIANTQVLALDLTDVTGKAKLGQNLPAERLEELLARMWLRGTPRDVNAIDLIRAANPSLRRCEFLGEGESRPDWRVALRLTDRYRTQALDLLEREYWNVDNTREEIGVGHDHATAWVGIVDPDGRLVGTARALSDRSKHAWIYDVAVAPGLRGQKIGSWLVSVLLDHPAVRNVKSVRLGTQDASSFYERFGFVVTGRGPACAQEMLREHRE